MIYDEDGYGCSCVRLPCVRKCACSTSAKKICVHCSCAWQKISAPPRHAATTSVRLRVCVPRIRTATAFYRLLNDWTSWLQPWESSVNEGS